VGGRGEEAMERETGNWSTEWARGKGKLRTQNTKHRTQNTERKTQNAKHRTQNSETLPLPTALRKAGKPAASRTALPGRQACRLKHSLPRQAGLKL